MSFWRSQNKIPIQQTSTAISSQNGLEYQANQIIHIDVPPSIKFIDPSETYLKCDFKINGDANAITRLQLDPQLGGSVLIKNLRIYTGLDKGAILLEEIQNYNSLMSVVYDYDSDDSIKNKRAISGEGCGSYNPSLRGTQGTPKTLGNNHLNNQFFVSPVANASGNVVNAFTNDSFTTAKLLIPLRSGIFNSRKVYPNLLTGLRLELELCDAGTALRQMEGAMRFKNLGLNPVFDSINGSTSGNKVDWTNGSASDKFYIQRDNSQYKSTHLPLAIGEKLTFVKDDLTATAIFHNASGNPQAPKISSINASANASGGLGLIEIVLDEPYTNVTGAGVNIDKDFRLVSDAIEDLGGNYSPNFTLSNVELIVGELNMSSNYEASMVRALREGGNISLDVLSVTNYKHSVLASDVVANIRLGSLEQTRARAILNLPTDQTNYSTANRITATTTYDIGNQNNMLTNRSDRSGLVGISSGMKSYQYYYSGKLNPSRAISTEKISSKVSIDAQPLIENEKSLIQCDIPVRSFSQFNNNYFISRALGLNRQVYNTIGKDFNVLVNYDGTGTKNILFNNYVFHIRSIVIKNDSIMVQT